jgi:hypothetical protein
MVTITKLTMALQGWKPFTCYQLQVFTRLTRQGLFFLGADNGAWAIQGFIVRIASPVGQVIDER